MDPSQKTQKDQNSFWPTLQTIFSILVLHRKCNIIKRSFCLPDIAIFINDFLHGIKVKIYLLPCIRMAIAINHLRRLIKESSSANARDKPLKVCSFCNNYASSDILHLRTIFRSLE